MALSTYTELKSSLADWLNRSDLTSVIPDFISLAEAQIERQLRTRQMIVRATASFAAAAEYGTVPDDFLETYDMSQINMDLVKSNVEFLKGQCRINGVVDYL